jgi:hypothetical protein
MHVCGPNIQRKETVKLASYIAWNIWKEPGRHVFQDKAMNAAMLAHHIREEMTLVTTAYHL